MRLRQEVQALPRPVRLRPPRAASGSADILSALETKNVQERADIAINGFAVYAEMSALVCKILVSEEVRMNHPSTPQTCRGGRGWVVSALIDVGLSWEFDHPLFSLWPERIPGRREPVDKHRTRKRWITLQHNRWVSMSRKIFSIPLSTLLATPPVLPTYSRPPRSHRLAEEAQDRTRGL